MQSRDLEKLIKEWGDKPCEHPSIEKLYDLGSHDGYVCSQCGKFYLNKQEYYEDKKKFEQ